MKKTFVVLFLMVLFVELKAQKEFNLKDGDRVCFVGNSITKAGGFHHYIMTYYMTRFPNQKNRFFNCGVSGDTGSGVLKRLDEDILINQPDYAVIMLGMNDVSRGLYRLGKTFDVDTLSRREKALANYRNNLEKIVNSFSLKEIEVLLELPSIYDQTMECETFNNFGVNEALRKCADYNQELAEDNQLITIDYWTIMTELNKQLQQQDKTKTIIGKDRVHPGWLGHFVMAYQFLKSVDAPKYVSKIHIAKNDLVSNQMSQNCLVSHVKNEGNKLLFEVTEQALPFPILQDQTGILDFVPFANDFNVELLTIEGLSDRKYELKIDSQNIGLFTGSQLKKGVNLAEYPSTPQYKQALDMVDVLQKLWQAESKLRDLKFIEYNQYFSGCPDKNDLNQISTYLDSVFTEHYTNPHYKVKLKEYVEYKPFEDQYQRESVQLIEEAYQVAQPKKHRFALIPVSN